MPFPLPSLLSLLHRARSAPTLNLARPVDWIASTLCSAVLTFLFTCTHVFRREGLALSASQPSALGHGMNSGSNCRKLPSSPAFAAVSSVKMAKSPLQLLAAACLHGVARRLWQACAQVDGEGSRHSAQADQQAPARWWHGGAGENESH